MSMSAIRGLMEDGERVLAEDVVEGANGKATPLVVTTRAFYLSVGGRYTRYAYAKVRAATFDTHDMFIALDGQAVRLKYRPGTTGAKRCRRCAARWRWPACRRHRNNDFPAKANSY